jgi:hypothetical protein
MKTNQKTGLKVNAKRMGAKMAIALGALMTMTVFQNCEAPKHGVDEGASTFDKQSFMAYPYSAAPEFYGDITLLKPASQSSNLAQFKFLGTVAYLANKNAAITYTVTVKSATGAAMCPTQTGTLAANSRVTLIEFDCVTTNQSKSALIEMTVASSGKSYKFTEAYAE